MKYDFYYNEDKKRRERGEILNDFLSGFVLFGILWMVAVILGVFS